MKCKQKALTWSTGHIYIFLKVSLRKENISVCISTAFTNKYWKITVKWWLCLPWAGRGHFGKIHQNLHWCLPAGLQHDISQLLEPAANHYNTTVLQREYIWCMIVYVHVWIMGKHVHSTQKGPRMGGKPVTFLLWGNSSEQCLAVPHITIMTLLQRFKCDHHRWTNQSR